MQIVLAKVEDAYEVEREGRVDIGERHKMRRIDNAKALMWKSDGDLEDFDKAQAFTESEGYHVFTYDKSERDPLGRAKKDVLKATEHDREKRQCKLEFVGKGASVQGRCKICKDVAFLPGYGRGTPRQQIKTDFAEHKACVERRRERGY